MAVITLELPPDLSQAIHRIATVERTPANQVAIDIVRSALEAEGWIEPRDCDDSHNNIIQFSRQG